MEEVKLILKNYTSIFNNETLIKLKDGAQEKCDALVEYLHQEEMSAINMLAEILKENNIEQEEFIAYLSYAALIIMAVTPIYIGAKKSRTFGKYSYNII